MTASVLSVEPSLTKLPGKNKGYAVDYPVTAPDRAFVIRRYNGVNTAFLLTGFRLSVLKNHSNIAMDIQINIQFSCNLLKESFYELQSLHPDPIDLLPAKLCNCTQAIMTHISRRSWLLCFFNAASLTVKYSL